MTADRAGPGEIVDSRDCSARLTAARTSGRPGALVTAVEAKSFIGAALTVVGLDGTESGYPWQSSGGMQQRVAITGAVAYEPSVLLMGEPFATAPHS